MNILNINLPKQHFYSLIELVNSGHTVYTNWHDCYEYEKSLGLIPLGEEDNNFINYSVSTMEGDQKHKKFDLENYVAVFVEALRIDVLQVGSPVVSYLHTFFKDHIKYIGPPEKVARLETDKLFSKKVAETVGLKVPAILKEGRYSDDDYGKNISLPSIEKPSHIWAPAVNYFTNDDVKKAIELRDLDEFPRNENNEYYIEEYLNDIIETNVFFAVSNGEYVITHTQEIVGENLNKTIDQKCWYIGSYISPLDPEIDTIVRNEAKKYLDHICKWGGSYEGSFCGAYTKTGEWYFLEMNVRPDIFNSTPIFMNGNDYIKGLFEDISLFSTAWKNINCDKLLITTLDSDTEYPLHLHDKHNVRYPNNLKIKNGKYYVTNYGSDVGCGTIIADHNIPKDFVKEIEETTMWKFNEKPNLSI